MKCKIEGCDNWPTGDKDLCWDHYRETVPAFEEDISSAVIEWLKYRGYEKHTIHRAAAGYSNSIFDVVAAKQHPLHIIGIEIKSDHDSFYRLSRQLPEYLGVFDEVYLCLDEKKAPFHPLIGILRYEAGKVSAERDGHIFHKSGNILSKGEMHALCLANGVDPADASKIWHALDVLPSIRRKLVYNRFFAKMDWEKKIISNHIEFTDNEINFLLQLGVKTNVNVLRHKLLEIEKISEGTKKLIRAMNKAVDETKQETLEPLEIL